MATPALLLFDGVSKWYGPVLGLNQVTLELRSGITGLVGANGAGKSTLIKLATGQIRPTLGSVQIQGTDAWDWRARRLVGYCPDHDNFYEDMSGREFVRTMAKLSGAGRDAGPLADRLIDRVGMADRADRKLRGYSKGMRQRIKLAQALITDPALLVLDEPLAGIDPVGRQELLALFRSLADGGKCLLVSSHELQELEKLTNHVAVMARGRIAAVGTLDQIRQRLDDYPTTLRIAVRDARRAATLLLRMPDVSGVEVDGDAVVVVRAGHPQRFAAAFGELVLREHLDVQTLEPLDDSAHAILGYLLGGSGKT
jgi:ABC-2 type transport system ATP-binding protein